jgi:hypothetical protein
MDVHSAWISGYMNQPPATSGLPCRSMWTRLQGERLTGDNILVSIKKRVQESSFLFLRPHGRRQTQLGGR